MAAANVEYSFYTPGRYGAAQNVTNCRKYAQADKRLPYKNTEVSAYMFQANAISVRMDDEIQQVMESKLAALVSVRKLRRK